MKIYKMFPVVLAVSSVILFVLLIIKHEHHLSHAQSVYVHLQPVDPRSILQGDYMVLNYGLNLHDASDQQIQNQAQLMSYVALDAQQRVIKTSLKAPQDKLQSAKPVQLILKNPKNQLDSLYPAANSFLFAEGLEPCYRNAEYAHLRVKSNGKALLAELLNEKLKPLNCEQQKSWIEGGA